jgi:predicted flap endonuclease-1-like 5' DNA nuclease
VQHSRLRADLTAGAGSLAKIKAELAALQMDNERLRGELHAANGSLGQYKAELGALNTNLSAAQADNDRLRAERATTQTTLDVPGVGTQYKTQLLSIDPTLAGSSEGVHVGETDDRQDTAEAERMHAVGEQQRDPLIDINGIGPVYQQRLFDAGIYTFAELAAQSPARLRELVGAKSWQETETETWIAEARQFTQAGGGRST